jgi:hypothetical protein
MLQLTGYMQGELAVTFQLRLPSTEPFALLYRKGDVWSYKDLSALEARNLNSQLATLGSDYHVLIERVHGEKTLHCVRSHNLPI